MIYYIYILNIQYMSSSSNTDKKLNNNNIQRHDKISESINIHQERSVPNENGEYTIGYNIKEVIQDKLMDLKMQHETFKDKDLSSKRNRLR